MDNGGGSPPGGDDERWSAFFADVEGELAAADARELADEVAERTRAERAGVGLEDRLAGSVGAPVELGVDGGPVHRGRLVDVGAGWLALEAGDGSAWLVALGSVTWLGGVGGHVAPAPRLGRAPLVSPLRGLARDRAPVVLHLRGGVALRGTLDEVLADGVVLAEVGPAEGRREVRRRLVPLAALVAVQQTAGGPRGRGAAGGGA